MYDFVQGWSEEEQESTITFYAHDIRQSAAKQQQQSQFSTLK